MKIIALSLLLSCFASADKNITHDHNLHDQHVAKWDSIMQSITKDSPFVIPTIVQTHLIDDKGQLLLCNESNKWNVPMGFMTHQDASLVNCAQRVVTENVGLQSYDWREFGRFDTTAYIPKKDGHQPEKFHARLYLSQEFTGSLKPDRSLYTECRWHSSRAIPDDRQLSNLSLEQKQLQNLLRVVQDENQER